MTLCAANQASLSFPASQSLLKFMSIELVMLPNHLILCHPFSLCLPSFPALGSFRKSLFLTSCDQSIGTSALTSVLPKNIRGWFLLGLTSLISLQSKVLSKVFHTTILKHNSSALRLLYGPALTSIHDYWRNHSFDYTGLCQQSDVSAF